MAHSTQKNSKLTSVNYRLAGGDCSRKDVPSRKCCPKFFDQQSKGNFVRRWALWAIPLPALWVSAKDNLMSNFNA